MRVKPIQHRILQPSEGVPDSLHFFNFLQDQVKSAGPGVQWNPFALRTTYRKVHPSHVGYSCWINIIPGSGTPCPILSDMGSRKMLLTCLAVEVWHTAPNSMGTPECILLALKPMPECRNANARVYSALPTENSLPPEVSISP